MIGNFTNFCPFRPFDELSIGSVSCLLINSFKKQFHNATTGFVYTEIDDHGIRWGDMVRILARSRRSVASRVALDLPYWVMRSALYCLTRMAFKMARKAGACCFMSCITIAKQPCYGPLKIKPSYINVP